jgi:hypothetical protein
MDIVAVWLIDIVLFSFPSFLPGLHRYVGHTLSATHDIFFIF